MGIFTVQLEDAVPELVDISFVKEALNFDSSVFILNFVVTHSIASCGVFNQALLVNIIHSARAFVLSEERNI